MSLTLMLAASRQQLLHMQPIPAAAVAVLRHCLRCACSQVQLQLLPAVLACTLALSLVEGAAARYVD
jgi:hypothetical protein